MILYPAIDLMSGKCVRLFQGDFNQKTNYNLTPESVAQKYKADGAYWLHLVDLDGARDPSKRQIQLIRSVIKASGLNVQTGGGIRSAQDVQDLLEAGASRIVIGSLSYKNKKLTKEILKQFGPEHICLAFDVKPDENDYMIAASGWQEDTLLRLEDSVQDYIDSGLKHILCTDISRDGTLQGCNVSLYKHLKVLYPSLAVQASGGIGSLDDIKALDADGAIIGKALYEGIFSLPQALEVAAC